MGQSLELPIKEVVEQKLDDMHKVAAFFGLWVFLPGGFITALAAVFLIGWNSAAALMLAIASLALGAALGFLFGIPKTLQESSGAPVVVPTPAPAPVNGVPQTQSVQVTIPRGVLKTNTSLEEISEWLTKIIVGLGLVHIGQIADAVKRLSHFAAASFGTAGSGESFALTIIVFYSVTGGLFSYLMTRLYLQLAFARIDSALRGDVPTQTAQISALTSIARELGRRTDVAFPSPKWLTRDTDMWQSDPWKGFAEGDSTANGRKLSATIEAIGDSGDSTCNVILSVTSVDPRRPLTGKVLFHLHPTFENPDQDVEVCREGRAELSIIAIGAFTAAAEADNGETKLELDLNAVPGGPDEFYS